MPRKIVSYWLIFVKKIYKSIWINRFQTYIGEQPLLFDIETIIRLPFSFSFFFFLEAGKILGRRVSSGPLISWLRGCNVGRPPISSGGRCIKAEERKGRRAVFTEWEKRTSQTGIIVRVRATHRRPMERWKEEDSWVGKKRDFFSPSSLLFSFGKFSIISLSLLKYFHVFEISVVMAWSS